MGIKRQAKEGRARERSGERDRHTERRQRFAIALSFAFEMTK